MNHNKKLINKIKNSLSHFDDTLFLDFINNDCIIYGSCLLMLLNDESQIPIKFNILCTRNKSKELHAFFIGNGFKFYKIISRNPR